MSYRELIGGTASYSILKKWGFSEALLTYLEKNNVVPNVIHTWDFPFENIVRDRPEGKLLKKSQFLNSGESNFFSQLIRLGLNYFPDRKVKKIIDLGCGSSVPTLGAMSACRNSNPALSLVGVDIDPDAIEISKFNSEILGMKNRSQFVLQDLNSFLNEYNFGGDGILLSANPPYVPVPQSLADPFFAPVSAGSDGLKYLRTILKKNYDSGTLLVLLAGSFSSPHTLIKEIESSYKILRIESYLNQFGPYTTHSNLLPYLLQMRENGSAVFGVDEEGIYVSLVFGFVLERK